MLYFLYCLSKDLATPRKNAKRTTRRVATPRLKTSALNHQGNTKNWTTMINIM